jgi:pilus assembly protein CpaB
VGIIEKFRTMKRENKMLVFSAVCGLLAVIAGYAAISMKESQINEMSRPVKVILAAKYIAARAQVTRDMVKEGEMPAKFATEAVARDFKDIKGYIALAPFVEDEPILINKLSRKAEQLSSNVPTGLRAIAIPVDETSSCGYMIKPGDDVDVLLTYDKALDKRPYMVTSTMLQCARVIAVGEGLEDGENSKKYSSISLAVSPQEAQLLAFASEKGRFTLLLRPAGEKDRARTSDMTFEEMVKFSAASEKDTSVRETPDPYPQDGMKKREPDK